MNKEIVLKKLAELKDENYSKFVSRLIPQENEIWGVRLPQLRLYAKELSKQDWQSFLALPDTSPFELVMLQGMALAYAKVPFAEKECFLIDFLKKVNNWSICDSTAMTYKFKEKEREEVFQYIKTLLLSKDEFVLRFSSVLLLNNFIIESHIDQTLEIFDNMPTQQYYVQMAVAWGVSVAMAKFPEKTFAFMKSTKLDDFTFNKAIQKSRESFRVSEELKSELLLLKR